MKLCSLGDCYRVQVPGISVDFGCTMDCCELVRNGVALADQHDVYLPFLEWMQSTQLLNSTSA